MAADIIARALAGSLRSSVEALAVNSNATIGVYDLTAAGTVNAITATYTNLTYFTYLKILVATTGVNTGAATININSLGVKNIRIKGSDGVNVALIGGEIPPYALMEYDGTDFVLLNSRTGETSVTSTVTQNITSLPVYAEGQLKATVKGNIQSPYDSYTKFLMLWEGANNSKPATDATGKSIAWSGDAKITTAQSKFGASSGVFDGTGDYITVTDANNELDIGTQDFCIETWVRFNSVGGSMVLLDFRQVNETGDWPNILFETSDKKIKYRVGSTIAITGTTTITTGTWYHIAVARIGGTTKLFVNGGQEGSNYSDTNNYSSVTDIKIGSNLIPDAFLNGWLDETRISVGSGRYASNFVPTKLDVLPSDRMRVLATGKNLINPLQLVIGDISSTSGANTTSTTWLRNNSYIPCKASTTYTRTSPSSSFCAFYDSQYRFVSGSSSTSPTSPSNAAYMRWSFSGTDFSANIMVEQGSTATTYEQYTETSAIVPVALNNVSSTIKDTFDANTGVHTKNVSDFKLMNSYTWAFLTDYTGFKRFNIANTATPDYAFYNLTQQSTGFVIYDDTNKTYPTGDTSTTAGVCRWSGSSGVGFMLSISDTITGFVEAWDGTTSFTGLTWANLIKAYMNGWKLTTANTNVASCEWTGIASGTTQSGSSGYTTVTTTVDTGYQPYRLIYQLATPVVTNYLPNVLNAEQSGTIYVEPFVEDVALYGTNITIENSAYPIDSLSYVYRINVANGALTPIALSSCTVAANKLSFTITGAAVNEYYLYGYTYSGLSTVPDLTYSYTAEIQEQLKVLDQKIETLNAIEKKRMMTAPVTLGSISATTTQICFIAPASCAIQSFQLCNGGAIAASNTDYWTFALVDKGSDGTASNTIVTKSTQVTGGQAIAAYDAYDLGTMDMTHRVLAEGDVVVLTITKTGSATALTEARGILRFTLL